VVNVLIVSPLLLDVAATLELAADEPPIAAVLDVKACLICLPKRLTTKMAATATMAKMIKYSVMAMPRLFRRCVNFIMLS